MIEDARADSIKITAWNVNTLEKIKAMLQPGADGI
jgi:hypothetical protein